MSDDVLTAPQPGQPARPAPPAPAAPAARRRPGWQRLAQRYGAVAVLGALFAYNAVATPYFLSFDGLVNNLLQQAAPIAIVALGMALVIATGGIDLSVGSVMAIAGQLGALVLGTGAGAWPAWGAALAVAVGCGLFNGVLVARYGVQPIIATLILFIAGRGIAQLVSGGNLQDVDDPLFQFFGLGRIAGLPASIGVLGMTAAVVAAVLRWTTLGRYVVAVGGNETSSRLAGVPVARTKVLVYVVSGLLAGLVGLVAVGINSSSDANNIGLGMELDAIAAVAVAGVPLTGGRVTVLGTVVGAVTLKLLQNTLISHGIPLEIAQIVEGGVIIVALWVQRAQR